MPQSLPDLAGAGERHEYQEALEGVADYEGVPEGRHLTGKPGRQPQAPAQAHDGGQFEVEVEVDLGAAAPAGVDLALGGVEYEQGAKNRSIVTNSILFC